MNDGEVVSYDSVDNTFKDVDMLQNMGLGIPQITFENSLYSLKKHPPFLLLSPLQISKASP